MSSLKFSVIANTSMIRNRSRYSLLAKALASLNESRARTTRGIKLFKRTQPSEYPFLIYRATKEDIEDVLDLMFKSYFIEEPTTAALGVGKERHYILENFAIEKIESGKSLVARCKENGHLCGAALNNIVHPWDGHNMAKKANDFTDLKLKKLYLFYAFVTDYPKLWEKYGTNEIFEMENLFVSKNTRNMGLGQNLTKAAMELASDLNYKVFRVDATNPRTKSICENLDFKLVEHIPYCEYLDDDGMPLIKMSKDNRFLHVFVHLLQQK